MCDSDKDIEMAPDAVAVDVLVADAPCTSTDEVVFVRYTFTLACWNGCPPGSYYQEYRESNHIQQPFAASQFFINKKGVLSQRLPHDALYLYNKKIPK